MKVLKFMFIILLLLEFVSARPSQRNKEVAISTPMTKVLTTTPSTTVPRPIPRPIGKMVFFLQLDRSEVKLVLVM